MATKRPRATAKASGGKRQKQSGPFRPSHRDFDPLMGRTPAGTALERQVRRFQRAIDDGERVREWERFADVVEESARSLTDAKRRGGKTRAAQARSRQEKKVSDFQKEYLTLVAKQVDSQAAIERLAKKYGLKPDWMRRLIRPRALLRRRSSA